MSAKDSFFQKVEDNASKQKADEEAFKQDILAFQQDTKALLTDIKSWFDGSPIKTKTSTMQMPVDGSTSLFEVATLTLHNGDKTLSITPEGFYYYGVTGSLTVTIDNPNHAPREFRFSLHWADSLSQIDGWVIAHSGSVNTQVQRIKFDQENFFNMISSFA
ncbi:hypothetical protein DOX53_22390 [Cronobacter malonaticus]|jgi:hypothetical protein|uniref:hypothetical protein n=1 Tax=Enterobacteriaceae TaxID=543 RepID=UPI0019314BD9|nr:MULTISPECIES: hypothetical protein [Enterobacteriaceae]EGT4490431.1 hypothetical protein [Cronobacter malonaticus]EKK5222556.1 hypothetical protein [Cronobacter sakazakii]EKY4008732.1 hypothetical protein [Enterobacter roggenkampii]HCM9561606.1 hypothetical protein [Enterobacter cloacae subsp. cloacae]ELY3796870.1 hypothetical protein [Cronobacter sakazakii]